MTVNTISIMEDISKGENIRKYSVEAWINNKWEPVCEGRSMIVHIGTFSSLTSRICLKVLFSSPAPPVWWAMQPYGGSWMPATPCGRWCAIEPAGAAGASSPSSWSVGVPAAPETLPATSTEFNMSCTRRRTSATGARPNCIVQSTSSRWSTSSPPRRAAPGFKRWIQISSLGVYPGRDHHGTDETAEIDIGGLDGYTRTKAEAEIVLRTHMDRGFPAVILRPGFIYGPGDRHVLPRIIEKLRAGKMKLIGDGRKLLNDTYVGNLVEAVLLALVSEGPSEEPLGGVSPLMTFRDGTAA